MSTGAGPRRKVGEHCRCDQRMDERQGLTGTQEMRVGQCIGGVFGAADVKAGKIRRKRQRRLVQDRHRRREPRRVFRQPAEADDHGVEHRVRHEFADPMGSVGRRRDAVGMEHGDQFLQQEGIAAGDVSAGQAECGLGGWKALRPHDFGYRMLAQGSGSQPYRARV